MHYEYQGNRIGIICFDKYYHGNRLRWIIGKVKTTKNENYNAEISSESISIFKMRYDMGEIIDTSLYTGILILM